MSRPTLHPTWDTSATHCTAPSGGHVTSGYAANEIPTSDEMNEWMRRVGAEFLWINAQLDDVTTLPQSVTRSPYTTGFVTTPAQLNTGSNIKIPVLGLKKGDTIVAIRARGIDFDTPPAHSKFKVELFSITDGTASGSLAASPESAGDQLIHTVEATGLSIAVADLTDYVLRITESTGSANITIHACSVDVQRPA